TAPRQAERAGGPRLRDARDAGVPAPVARLRRGAQGRREAGTAPRGRRLQPLRDARDAREPLRSARPRGAGADEARRGVTRERISAACAALGVLLLVAAGA